MKIARIARRFLAAAKWLVIEGARAWAPLLVPLGILAVVLGVAHHLPGAPEDHARYAGLMLEAIGIFTVAHGLRGRGTLFGRQGLPQRISDWFARRPRLFRKERPVYMSAHGTVNVTSTARASLWRLMKRDGTVEDRIQALQSNVEMLYGEWTELGKTLHQEIQDRKEVGEDERRLRETAVRDIRERLEALGAGGLHIEWVGVICLMLGLVLGTIPGEVVSLIGFP